jgi:hypothetical protein
LRHDHEALRLVGCVIDAARQMERNDRIVRHAS